MCHYSVEILTVAEPACFAFCVELLAVLATQYHPNALTNSNLDLATTIILPYQPGRNMNENSFHILKWGIHSAQERPGVEQQDAGKQGPRITQESSEEADAAPCYPENTMLSCMHHSCALQRWNEGQVFPPCYFTKHLEKTQSRVQTKTRALAICFSCFLPCLAAAGTGILIQLLATKSLEATGVWVCVQLLLLFHLLLSINN